MTSTWVVRIANADDWDPVNVVHGAPRLGKVAGPTVRLGEVAEPIAPQPLPASIRDWVVPPHVDLESGTVRIRRSGNKAGVGYALGVNLLAGDILVPRRSARPCVLVDDRFEGVAFSEGFTAIRCRASVLPSLLWALLSSRSGSSVRRRLLSGGTIPHLSWRALREVALHLPPLDDQSVLVQSLPRPSVDRGDRPVSTWIVTSALDGDWQRALIEATLGFGPGREVRDVTDVVRGRVRAKDREELPLPGLAPVCLPEMIRRKDWRPSYWAIPVEPMTDGRSIALPAVRRFHAAIPPPGMTLGHGAFLLRPRDDAYEPDRAQLLCDWLNGEQAQTVLAGLSASHLIPGVTLSGLRGLPIPADWSGQGTEEATHARRSLADRLEEACR